MRSRHLAHLLSAAALVAVPVVAFQAPAFGQTAGGPCVNPAGQYPPPVQACRGLSTAAASPGQQMSGSTGAGAFDPGTRGRAGTRSVFVQVGTFVADAAGRATVTYTVPTSLEVGQHNLVFLGTKNGAPAEVALPFTVVAAGAGNGTGVGNNAGGGGTGAGNNGSGPLGALPRTGADAVVPMLATGASLVLVGAGMVFVARRRRDEMDSATLT